ncbi:hypothetical protein [Leptospira adleri]|uniref:Uncharacterized protein n=1 Tax=Leptospira adleri TaxID=2023186 RepID=A0A2M9YJ89_9LEPT|nr:hypothetical protein [Leptospira adleri]PJZ51603.1 hypothetical protein CH380_19345 [Leptospira adleri]PJZ61888.1 hypothetical protein CH376_10820 [Leptospira adleri]
MKETEYKNTMKVIERMDKEDNNIPTSPEDRASYLFYRGYGIKQVCKITGISHEIAKKLNRKVNYSDKQEEA